LVFEDVKNKSIENLQKDCEMNTTSPYFMAAGKKFFPGRTYRARVRQAILSLLRRREENTNERDTRAEA